MMMRYLLLLFLPLTAMAQFGIEQPFFSAPAAGSWTPASQANLSYWWKQSSLTNGNNWQWTDSVQGRVLTNATAIPVIKDEIGAFFNAHTYMSNNSIFLTNWTIGFSIRWCHLTYTPSAYVWSKLWGSSASDFGILYYGNGQTPTGDNGVRWGSDANSWWTDPELSGLYADVIYTWSNNTTAYLYTNGVFANSVAKVTDDFKRLAYVTTTAQDTPWEGYISDVCIWTNTADANSFASNFHSYSTNQLSLEWSTEKNFITNSLATSGSNAEGDITFGLWFVPSREMRVTQLGRWVLAGNSATHTLSIGDDLYSTNIATVLINLSLAPGTNQFYYVSLTNANPVILRKGKAYHIGSTEVNGGDTHVAYGSMISDRVLGGYVGGRWIAPSVHDGTPDNGGVGMDFKYK